MLAFSHFLSLLPEAVRGRLLAIETPLHVQELLDATPYNAEERDRSPLNVLLDGQCHCLDGGFLAALLLGRLGHTPLVLDMTPARDLDDDHVLALYRIDGRWGAVAKSNYVHLGFREPVYRDVRELVMSYFEHYMNTRRQRTLRGYTRPMDLSRSPDPAWAWDEPAANRLYRRFYARKSIQLLSPSAEERLTLVREHVFRSETLGTDMSWVFGNRSR